MASQIRGQADGGETPAARLHTDFRNRSSPPLVFCVPGVQEEARSRTKFKLIQDLLWAIGPAVQRIFQPRSPNNSSMQQGRFLKEAARDCSSRWSRLARKSRPTEVRGESKTSDGRQSSGMTAGCRHADGPGRGRDRASGRERCVTLPVFCSENSIRRDLLSMNSDATRTRPSHYSRDHSTTADTQRVHEQKQKDSVSDLRRLCGTNKRPQKRRFPLARHWRAHGRRPRGFQRADLEFAVDGTSSVDARGGGVT